MSELDGKVVMENSRVLTVDEGGVLKELQERAQSLWNRAAG